MSSPVVKEVLKNFYPWLSPGDLCSPSRTLWGEKYEIHVLTEASVFRTQINIPGELQLLRRRKILSFQDILFFSCPGCPGTLCIDSVGLDQLSRAPLPPNEPQGRKERGLCLGLDRARVDIPFPKPCLHSDAPPPTRPHLARLPSPAPSRIKSGQQRKKQKGNSYSPLACYANERQKSLQMTMFK